MTRSNQAPRDGRVTIDPAQGMAAITTFTVAAEGWHDETTQSIEFQFYRFPLSSGTLEVVNGSLVCASWTCDMPEVEWDDSTSPNDVAALGGVILKSWSQDSMASNVLFPAGSFIVAVRARDALGAYGESFSFGPVVGVASNVQAQQLLDAFSGPFSSEPPLAVLNTIEVLTSAAPAATLDWTPEDKTAVKEAAISAVQAAAGNADGDAETVQRVGEVVSSLVTNLGRATDMGSSDLAQLAAGLADSLSTNGSAISVTQTAAQAIVGGAVAVMSGSSSGSGSPALSAALESVALRLGNAMAAGALQGEASEVRLVDASGRGMALSVLQESVADVGSGTLFLGGDVALPMAALSTTGPSTSARRMSAAGAAACSTVSVQKTEYIGHNIYSWASSRWLVPQNASLTRVEIRQCGTHLAVVAQPFMITLAVDDPPRMNGWRPVCLRFDEVAQTWSTGSVRAQTTIWQDNVTCLSIAGAGTYAIAFEDVLGSTSDNPTQAGAPFMLIALTAVSIALTASCAGLALAFRFRERFRTRATRTLKQLEVEVAAHDVDSISLGSMPEKTESVSDVQIPIYIGGLRGLHSIRPLAPAERSPMSNRSGLSERSLCSSLRSWLSMIKIPDMRLHVEEARLSPEPIRSIGEEDSPVESSVAGEFDASADHSEACCCPAGHRLEPYATQDDFVACDACNVRGRDGDIFFACRECNYDKCITCAGAQDIDVLMRTVGSPHRARTSTPTSMPRHFGCRDEETAQEVTEVAEVWPSPCSPCSQDGYGCFGSRKGSPLGHVRFNGQALCAVGDGGCGLGDEARSPESPQMECDEDPSPVQSINPVFLSPRNSPRKALSALQSQAHLLKEVEFTDADNDRVALRYDTGSGQVEGYVNGNLLARCIKSFRINEQARNWEMEYEPEAQGISDPLPAKADECSIHPQEELEPCQQTDIRGCLSPIAEERTGLSVDTSKGSINSHICAGDFRPEEDLAALICKKKIVFGMSSLQEEYPRLYAV